MLDNFPRNLWYVAAWANELDGVDWIDRVILGQRLLIYRTEDGEAIAMRNRCPHRSAPLTAGSREGDDIRCGYHGMLFDRAGHCLAIPGQSVIPPTAAVTTLPAVDRHGWIWIWPGDPGLADPATIPQIGLADHSGWTYFQGYLRYQAAAELLHDNLLDFSHLEFVHKNTLGGDANWADRPQIRRIDGGFDIRRRMTGAGVPPFLRSVLPPDMLMDIQNDYIFVAPGVLSIDTDSWTNGTPQLRAGNVSCQAVTPENDSTAHYFFSVGVPEQTPAPIFQAMVDGLLAAFEEDRRVIEAQQALLVAEPDVPISRTGLANDAPMIQMRALLRKLAAAEK